MSNTETKGNRLFRDQRCPNEVITENQLRREFGEKLLENEEMDGITFEQYLHNCMESQDGTLSLIQPEREPQPRFTILIRETLVMQVTVEASDKESAMDEAMRLYDDGEYDLDRNCFAGAEFRPCCSHCLSDFDPDDDGLREIDAGTENAQILCDRCVERMEASGELTRCENCHELFSASRLKVNPATSLYEICPYCGKIWCE